MMGGANSITTAPEEGFRGRREAGCRYSVHSARYHGDVDEMNSTSLTRRIAIGGKKKSGTTTYHSIQSN